MANNAFRERGVGEFKAQAATIMVGGGAPLEFPNPLGEVGNSLSDSDLRETAYCIFVAAGRSFGGKPLTYISQSEKAERASSVSVAPPSLQRSLTSTAASKVKKALGLKSSSSKSGAGKESSAGQAKSKVPMTVGELMRVQMGISEQTDSRIRRGLLRIAAGQVRTLSWKILKLRLLNSGI